MLAAPLILLGAFAVVLRVYVAAHTASGAEMAPSDLHTAETMMHVTFPPSARVVAWHLDASGMDEYLRVKVEMAAEDWPAFLASTPLRDEPLDEGHHGYFGQDDGAWDPHQPAHLQAQQTMLPGGKVLNLGVDLGTPGKAVVYLVYFGT